MEDFVGHLLMVTSNVESTEAFDGTNVTSKVFGERSDIRTTTSIPATPMFNAFVGFLTMCRMIF